MASAWSSAPSIRASASSCTRRTWTALQGAKALGVSLPNTATAQELFNACAANGFGKLDHSALCRAIELMSNHEIAKAAK